jgi:hypothetical protein
MAWIRPAAAGGAMKHARMDIRFWVEQTRGGDRRGRVCFTRRLPKGLHNRDVMRPLGKVGLVVAGYVVAFLVAFAAVAIHVAAPSGPDRQGSSGMYAFGDVLLFLVVLAGAAVPSTAAALFLLRSYRSFWLLLSVVALGIAATGLVALMDYVASRTADAGSIVHAWSALAVLRILGAPLFALVFLLSGLFAPKRSSRVALLVATAIEAGVFAYVAFIWFYPFRSH